jgi:hypothetical protein
MPRGNVAERRAPNGVVTARPLYIRLLPAELEKIKARAATEGRSLGNMGRLLILSALCEPRNNKATQTTVQPHATSVVEG